MREQARRPATTTDAVPAPSPSPLPLTLDVIVEHTVLVLVAVEQTIGVVVAEVFELNEGLLTESEG